MTIDELLKKLREVSADPEIGHGEADGALVDFIEDGLPPERKGEVRAAFDKIDKWYA